MLKIHQLKKSTPPPVVTGLTNELWWQVCQRSLQASACILWPLPVFLAFFKSSFGVLKRFCSVHHGRQIGDPDSLWTGFRVVIGINNFMEICERGINQQLLRKLPGQSQLTANELDLGKYLNQHIGDTASLAIFVSNSVDKKTRMIFSPSRYFLVIRRICRKTKSNYEMSLGRIRVLVTWQN